MNNSINEKLTAEDFIDEFMCFWEKYPDRVAINCELNIASKEFGKCVNKIFFYCEDFEPEAQKNEQVKRFS